MTTAEAIQPDSFWLESQDYSVVPLNSRLLPHVREVSRSLREGVSAYPDSSRADFYDLELETGWAYVHVHDETQTVYVVAFSRN